MTRKNTIFETGESTQLKRKELKDLNLMDRNKKNLHLLAYLNHRTWS